MTRQRPVVLLFGPTAVGKTAISVQLAKEIQAEIVSVDSRLLYRGMDIGTAKPSPTLLKEVRHHLVDVADPGDVWSLARYLEEARSVIDALHGEGVVPLLVGGTGQYFAALVEGWSPPPKADAPEFRRRMRELARVEGEGALHSQLRRIDPLSADRIDPRNLRRVIRALEIHHVTGELPSAQRERVPPAYDFLKLGLKRSREEIHARIDERIEDMLIAGWEQEVAHLLAGGLDLNTPASSAIGYTQIAEYLAGKCDREDALREIKRLTRQYVRRQDTWFRRFEPDVRWFELPSTDVEKMAEYVKRWLEDQ